MKQSLRRLVVMLLALAITVGSFPTAALAAPSEDETAVTTEENAAAPSAEQDEATETQDPAQPAEQTQPEETPEEETEAEPEAQSEVVVEEEQSSEAVQADARLRKELGEYIRNQIFGKGETVIDVSQYNVTSETAETAANEVVEETETSEIIDTQIATDDDGNATVIVADVDPMMQMAIAEVNEGEGYLQLTEEQKTELVKAYAQYLDYMQRNADYFGVMVPYLSTKDTNENPVGSLLSIGRIYNDEDGKGFYTYDAQGNKVAASYDNMLGTIQIFQLGNAMGVNLLGDALLAAKDEAMSQIKDGMSDYQKLLVLNDWLAQKAVFDMPYIMAQGGGGDLVAEEPTDHPLKATLVDALQQQNLDAVTAGYMADNILGMWEGSQFGILADSSHKGVCMGYSYAYAYLVQWAFPEVYKDESGNWRSYKDVNFEPKKTPVLNEDGSRATDESGNPLTETTYVWSENTDAMVDYVRINYDTDVRMFGEINEGFESEHYWNAVKLGGKEGEWYYVDPCYTDGYIEFMIRERVETNGNMNHIYFMFSDTSARKLYQDPMSGDPYYSSLNTLYKGIATDTTYEDAWFAFAKSPVYADGSEWYYYYDSTDLFSMLDNYQQGEDTQYKLVYHDGTKSDADNSIVELVNFNNGTVLQNGNMVANAMLQELWAKHQEYIEKYPSIAPSCAYNDGKLYFNIANCVLSYDLSSGELVKVKEYNKVSALRDKTNPFGGMAFSVVEDGTEGALTVFNNPIASMTIKEGSLYVDIATNYAYISGREVPGSETHQVKDDAGYGWEYEETNYNSEYNSMLAQMGFGDETNDNDEFMWSANFTDVIELSHLTGTHEYESVTVDPYCGEDGFTENRCATCGVIEPGTREVAEGTALDHHYIQYHEVYYEKDNGGAFLQGDTYVCVNCKDAQEEQPENMGDHNYQAAFEWAEDYSSAKVTLTCASCSTNKLDCLEGVDPETYTKSADATITSERDTTCDQAGNIVYTATAELDGKTYTDTKKVAVEAGQHSYTDPEFIWAEDGKTCKVSYKCTNGDDDHTGDQAVDAKISEDITKEATCTEDGTKTYTASIELNGTTYTDTKEETVPKLGHSYTDPEFIWSEDGKTCKVSYKCERGDDDHTGDKAVDAEVTEESVGASCTESGTITYTATFELNGKSYSDEKTVTVDQLGHDYTEPEFIWADDNTCKVSYKCERGDDDHTGDKAVAATVSDEVTKEATCTAEGVRTYTATFELDGKTYTDTKKKAIEKLPHTFEDGVCTVCGELEKLNEVAFRVANSASGVKVTWTTASNAEFYRVYRKTSSTGWKRITQLDDKTASSYTDKTASSGTTYQYTVRAGQNKDGKEVLSPYKSAGTGIKYLAQPSVTVANASSGITVKWNKITGASGYRVYRTTTPSDSSTWERIATINNSSTVSYTDQVAVGGTNYYYTVRAVSGSTLSSYTTSVDILRLVQPKPTVANTATGVKVSWNSVTGAKTYRVYRKSTTGKIWGYLDEVGSDVRSFVDTTAKSGTTYMYTVKALAGSEMSTYNSGLTIKYLAQPSVTVANVSSGVTVKWDKITGASGYRVYRIAPKDSTWVRIATINSGSTVSYTDKNTAANTTYRYTVRAVSGSTLSSYTTKVDILRLTQPKPSVSNTATGVKVTWTGSTGAKTYRVYRKSTTGKIWGYLDEVGSDVRSFVDTTAKSGTTYMYTVKALAGSEMSSYNAGLTIKYLAQPSVSVAKSSTGVSVKWNKITGASGYRVYRLGPDDSNWVRISNISSGSTVSYTDKAAKKGVTYRYTVRAVSGSYLSSYKASASIKP